MPALDFAAPVRHRFTIHADAHPNVLARLLEPFVIHDVLPTRLDGAVHASGAYALAVEFACEDDLARRLGDRIEAIVVVRKLAREMVGAALTAAA